MTTIYSSAKICPFEKEACDLATEGLLLDPGELQVYSTRPFGKDFRGYVVSRSELHILNNQNKVILGLT
jgi:hypothetical protein